MKRHETAHSPIGSLRYPATKCRPASLQKGENTEQVDSWLSKRKNALNKQCRSQWRYFLTVSFNVCLLDWICPLIIAKTTFHRINVSSWFINGGRRTVSFYSSRVVPGLVLFQKKAVCHGNYWNNPRSLDLSLGKGYRVPAAVSARPQDAARTEDVSRRRVMMRSIEIPVSTWHNLPPPPPPPLRWWCWRKISATSREREREGVREGGEVRERGVKEKGGERERWFTDKW